MIVDAGSDDNKDIKSEEAACTNANTKWKEFIKEAASEVADEAACVAKCTVDDNCQYGVWVATGTKWVNLMLQVQLQLLKQTL